MKTAFAIFFSALLLIGQTVGVPAQRLIQSPSECARCDCGGKCCVVPSRSAPSQAPAAPTQNVSLKQSQLAPAAAQIYSLPESPAPPISSPSISLPKSQAVPLYERNCAYLI